MSDPEQGAVLAMDFLKRCQKKRVTGTVLLNAMGTALVGFFCSTDFDNDADRMKELDNFVDYLRSEVVAGCSFSLHQRGEK